jgi:ribosomal protein S5
MPTHWLQAFVVVGDYNGHVGLGVKCAKEVRIEAACIQHQLLV